MNKYMIITRSIFAIGCLIFIFGCGSDNDERTDGIIKKELAVELEKLRETILQENWDALNMAENIGSPAIPVLEELLKDENPEVRNIALNCVGLTNDEKQPKVIAQSLMDNARKVRVSAMQMLNTGYDSTIAPELAVNLKNPDSDIRSFAATLLGRLDDAKMISSLNEQLEEETDSIAKRSINLALARLGDEKLKNDFASGLDIPESKTRYRAIRDLEYINDKKLVVRLKPAFSDYGEVYEVGDPDNPVYARVCDAAINLVAKWYDKPFSFDTDDLKIYSDDGIEEARKFIETLEP